MLCRCCFAFKDRPVAKWDQLCGVNLFQERLDTVHRTTYLTSIRLRCVVTIGQTGSTGATGATGQRQAADNRTTTTTTQSPCDGPVGKQLIEHSNVGYRLQYGIKVKPRCCIAYSIKASTLIWMVLAFFSAVCFKHTCKGAWCMTGVNWSVIDNALGGIWN